MQRMSKTYISHDSSASTNLHVILVRNAFNPTPQQTPMTQPNQFTVRSAENRKKETEIQLFIPISFVCICVSFLILISFVSFFSGNWYYYIHDYSIASLFHFRSAISRHMTTSSSVCLWLQEYWCMFCALLLVLPCVSTNEDNSMRLDYGIYVPRMTSDQYRMFSYT